MKFYSPLLIALLGALGCAALPADSDQKLSDDNSLSSLKDVSICSQAYKGVKHPNLDDLDAADIRSHYLMADGHSSLETKHAFYEIIKHVPAFLDQCNGTSNVPLQKFLDTAYRDEIPHPLPATLKRVVFKCSVYAKAKQYPTEIREICDGYRGKLETSFFTSSRRSIASTTESNVISRKNSEIKFLDLEQKFQDIGFIAQNPIKSNPDHFAMQFITHPYFSESRQMVIHITARSRVNALPEHYLSVSSITIYRKIER